MSKVDRIKEEIGWLKIVFAVTAASTNWRSCNGEWMVVTALAALVTAMILVARDAATHGHK